MISVSWILDLILTKHGAISQIIDFKHWYIVWLNSLVTRPKINHDNFKFPTKKCYIQTVFFLYQILKRITKSTNGWIQIIQHIWIRAITTILESETNFIVLLWKSLKIRWKKWKYDEKVLVFVFTTFFTIKLFCATQFFVCTNE